MSPITTHVLDIAAGRPAGGIPVTLEFRSSDGWQTIAQVETDADGRARNLLAEAHVLEPGVYRLRFDTSARSPFFPEVAIEFRVENPREHYHVPLLLSPFGYSTYRGS